MSGLAIRVEGLSKRYLLGHQPAGGGLADVLCRWGQHVRSVPRQCWDLVRGGDRRDQGHRGPREFWALRDVSFEVRAGEAVGIIGRNGAGKSTLLKVLARITEPTSGRFGLRGRVSSLLEVGTGFHPELTGRENIFLSGTLLGMTRLEITRQFDAIVDFAEIEDFLDTPVKRYSSGMYMRLGFAIAAHLRSEILIVDEVLAVGDTQFRAKCLGKMNDVTSQGRTVLFVSHQEAVIRSLCQTAVYLQNGSVVFHGPSREAIELYTGQNRPLDRQPCRAEFEADPHKAIRIRSVELARLDDAPIGRIDIGDMLVVVMEYEVNRPTSSASMAVRVDRHGGAVFESFDTDLDGSMAAQRAPGRYRAKIPLPQRLLKAGEYSISVSVGISQIGAIDFQEDAIRFSLEELHEDLAHYSYSQCRAGQLIMPLDWQTECLSSVRRKAG